MVLRPDRLKRSSLSASTLQTHPTTALSKYASQTCKTSGQDHCTEASNRESPHTRQDQVTFWLLFLQSVRPTCQQDFWLRHICKNRQKQWQRTLRKQDSWSTAEGGLQTRYRIKLHPNFFPMRMKLDPSRMLPTSTFTSTSTSSTLSGSIHLSTAATAPGSSLTDDNHV